MMAPLDVAARAAYAAAGHSESGLLHIRPISGREAPNVIDFSTARARREEARKLEGHDDDRCA